MFRCYGIGEARWCNCPQNPGIVALDKSNIFERVWYAGVLHKLQSSEISGQVFNGIY